MKESMKSQLSKNNRTLVGVFLDNTRNAQFLNEMLYGISKQTSPVDLLIMHNGLTQSEIEEVEKYAKKPKITVPSQGEKGETVINEIETDGSINYGFCEISADGFASVFNQLFNFASEMGYEFFSVVEQEDIISPNWYANAEKYAEENNSIHVFLPLIRYNVNGVFNSFMNEAAWAEGMTEEAGKTDMNLLLRYSCIIPLGALFRIDSVKEYSESGDSGFLPMKESFKISHYYEFFLRMVYNDLKVLTVPRIGYEMRALNKKVFHSTSAKIPQNITQFAIEDGGMTQEEVRFWLELAKKEYFFDEDRKKVYEQVQA